ncbi:MAG: hypothetical protein M3R50_08650, partial [Bacteroidota bacterium]|nr:hypothetical protein [Bacteroidota bacterium]
MRRILLFIISFVSSAYAQNANNYLTDLSEIIFDEQNAFAGLSDANNASNASQNFNISYYRCEWKVDPAIRYISGEVTSYYKITSNANLIVFDLTNSLIADSVKQRNISLPFEHTDNILQIIFPVLVTSGTFDSVSVYYHGVPPDTGVGSFVNSSHAGVP